VLGSHLQGNDIERDKNMAIQIDISMDKIEAFCRRNHIRSLSLFGSVLRADFGPDSDVDVLIEFEPEQEPGLMELVGMQNELSLILERKVDMVERESVEQSQNYIRRRHILQSVEAVYVA
jgi:predicted nucleotidyltransferase